MSPEETIATIDELKNLDLSIYPIDEIVARLKTFRNFPAHATDYHVGNIVYRIRPNENEGSFKTISDLSYKPKKFNNTFQRASHPQQTMFYGSIIPLANQQSKIDAGRIIAIAEGSKLFRAKDNEDGRETVTFGMWRLQDTVSLATILHPDIEKNISPFARERAAVFMEWLSKYPEIEEQAKAILAFYAEEFAKLVEIGEPDYNYLHSAILTDFFLRNSKQNFHGVCYPSTRVEGEGINVAIHPDFVNAHMRLEGAMECIIEKRGDHFVCINLKVAWLNSGQTEFAFKYLVDPDKLDEEIEKGFNS